MASHAGARWLAALGLLLVALLSPCDASEPGLRVDEVTPGGAAAKAGLAVGDFLLTYGDRALPSVEALRAARENLSHQREVALRVRRGTQTLMYSVPTGPLGIAIRPDLPPEAQRLHDEARAALQSGQLEAAIAAYAAGAKAAVGDPAAVVFLWRRVGAARASQERWSEAQTAFATAWDLLGESPDAAVRSATCADLGRCCEHRGDTAAARRWYEQAAQIDQAADNALWAADHLSSLGAVAQAESDLPAAQEALTRALTLREQHAPGSLEVAANQQALGVLARARGDLAAAHAFHARALALREQLAPDSLDVAASLSNLGNVADSRGDLAAAAAYHTRALAIMERRAPDSLDLATVLNNLGVVARERGEPGAARTYHERALALRERLAPDSLDVATSLNNLGSLAYSDGDLATAQTYFARALRLRERHAPDSLDLASTLANVGNLALDSGDGARAQAYAARALAITERRAPASLAVARALHNLGSLARVQGDAPAARQYLSRALALRERLAPDSLDVAATLHSLGNLVYSQGDVAAAGRYYVQAVAIQERLAPGSLVTAQSYNSLGNILYGLSRLEGAQQLFEKALAIYGTRTPDSPDLAATRNNLGNLARDRGELAAAEQEYTGALAIYERRAPRSLDTAGILSNLGYLALKRNRFADARAFFVRATGMLEEHRRQIPGTEERAFFTNQYFRPYTGLLRAHVALHDLPAAFATLERGRARALVELLAERGAALAAALPGAPAERQRTLEAERTAAYRQLGKLDPRRDPARIEELRTQIERLAVEQRALTAEIRRASPQYAALQYPQALDLQRTMAALDAGTLLLAYVVDTDETYLFAVTRTGLKLYRIPVPSGELREKVEKLQLALAHRGLFHDRARSLYNLLLRPAQTQIDRAQRLLLCPDGPLHTLAFAALIAAPRSSPWERGRPARMSAHRVATSARPLDARRRTGGRDARAPRPAAEQYLVEMKPLHTIVSMSLYAEVRRQARRTSSPTTARVLALGDPAYPRATGTTPAVENPVATRGERLSRLPSTRPEVEAIARLYPKQTRVRLGTQATVNAARTESAGVRILHFACHGLLDNHDPLASALALSPTSPQDDGLLRAYEVMGKLRLHADLVVMSACETGLGAESRYEGIVGMTRAFQYAGAKSVLVSLWSIADTSTAELMTAFYRSLKSRTAKDEALRRGQLALLRSRGFSHPFYWAPFVLVGDWQ